MKRPIPILVDHQFSEALEDHLKYLKDNHYTPVHLKDVAGYLETQDEGIYPQNKIVILTFDDAYQDFYEQVRPLLEEYGFKAKSTVCVPTGFISTDPELRKLADWQSGPNLPIMTWKELETLKDEGFEIIPHSVSHTPLDSIRHDEKRLQDEIGGSKRALMDKLGIEEPQFFCLPGGDGWGKPEIEKVLRDERYVGALRAQYENGQGWNTFTIPRWEVTSDRTIASVLKEIANCT